MGRTTERGNFKAIGLDARLNEFRWGSPADPQNKFKKDVKYWLMVGIRWAKCNNVGAWALGLANGVKAIIFWSRVESCRVCQKAN